MLASSSSASRSNPFLEEESPLRFSDGSIVGDPRNMHPLNHRSSGLQSTLNPFLVTSLPNWCHSIDEAGLIQTPYIEEIPNDYNEEIVDESESNPFLVDEEPMITKTRT